MAEHEKQVLRDLSNFPRKIKRRGATAVRVTINELLGDSPTRRRAFEHGKDILEAAALIRGARGEAGLSLADLADYTGIGEKKLAAYERGSDKRGPTYAEIMSVGRQTGQRMTVVREKVWLAEKKGRS